MATEANLASRPECDNKTAFRDAKQAKAAATQAEHFYGTKLNVYRCRFCSLWHLSSA